MCSMAQASGRFWRVLQFPLTRLLLGFVILAAATLGARWTAQTLELLPTASVLLAIVAIVGAYVGFVRLVERRPVIELGRAGAVRDVARGLALGVALFATTMALLTLIGICHVGAGDGWRALWAPLVAAIGAGFAEELLIRGVVFRLVEESLGSWLAVLLSAALFGLLHGLNPGATVVSTLAIALEAGVLLAAAYVYSRRLWLPIGLHIGWNFTEGGLFGASVSGYRSRGLLRNDLHGPSILTGGAFGPEASIVAIALCFAVGVVLLARAWRRGNIVPPWWRRRAVAAVAG
jgi:uncharacterized protein